MSTPPEEIRLLWGRYQETKEHACFLKLVEFYVPVVHQIAIQYAAKLPNQVTQADVISYGYLGLMDAVKRFDPDRQIQFETYAVLRIRGAIIDELRAIDWVPRSIRRSVRQVDEATNDLTHSLGRVPTNMEIAERLDIRPEEVGALQRVVTSSVHSSLDVSYTEDGDGSSLGETILDDRGEDVLPSEAVLKERLVEALADLEERETIVVVLHYYQGMSLIQIGELLGVSESRVGQLHTKAMAEVREWLKV